MFSLLVALLTVLFIGLKITNLIAWSWIWVLAPAWIYILLCVLAFTFMIIYVIYEKTNS